MEGDSREIPACLVPTVCPNCAYSLEGLAADAACPECGRQRVKGEIVLYGWGRGHFENVATAKRSRIVWVAFVSSLYMIVWSLSALASPRERWYMFLYWAPVAGIWAYAYFDRRETRHPGQVQIRFTDEGCVQFANLNGPSVFMQLGYGYAWVAFGLGAVALLICYFRGWVGPAWFYFWVPFLGVLSVVWWRPSRKFRRDLANMGDGAMADANMAYRKVTPWGKVSEFSMVRGKTKETCILKITSFGGFVSAYPVDAEIICTEEQADELRKYLASRPMGGTKSRVDPVLLQKIREWQEEEVSEKESARQ